MQSGHSWWMCVRCRRHDGDGTSTAANDVAFAPMPNVPYGMSARPAGGQAAESIVSGNYYDIAKYDHNVPLALQFIKVSTSPAAQLEQFKIMGWMPVTQAGIQEVESAYPATVPFIQAEQNSTPTDYTPAWSYIETGVLHVIGQVAQQLATGANVLGVTVLRSLRLSIEFSVIATVASTPIAFFAALSVYHPFRGRALLRSVYLVPYVIPGFVIALLAQLAFHDTTGAVDKLLHALHLAPVTTFWLIGPNAFWAMTFTEVWEVWPFIYLLLLAGLQAIPRDQLEAATVDGAGWWGRLRYVVIPQLRGVYALAFALSTLFHFGNFTLPYIMFGTNRPSSTVTLPVNIYYIAFQGFDFGVASATAVFNVAVLAVPAAVFLWMTRLRTARRGGAGGGT